MTDPAACTKVQPQNSAVGQTAPRRMNPSAPAGTTGCSAASTPIPISPNTPSIPKNPASSVVADSPSHHSRVAMLPIAYSAPAATGRTLASPKLSCPGPSTSSTPANPSATAAASAARIARP